MISHYLILQVSVICGFVCSTALLFLWNKINRKTNCNQIKHINQWLILVGLLSPILFIKNIAPEVSLSNTIRQPLSEMATGLKTSVSHKIKISKTQSTDINDSERQFGIENVAYSDLLFVLVLCSLLIGFYRLLKNILSLRSLLKSSHIFRRFPSLRLAYSNDTAVPFSVWYFGRRWVVFPLESLTDRKKFQVSLKHEIEHQRAGDTVWAFALELLSPLFLLNPFYFLWKKSICELQEFSCDEALIGRKSLHPRKYGDCLIEVAETALRSRLRLSGVAGMANHPHTKTSLERRIRMLTHYSKKRPKYVLINTVGVLSVITVLFTAATIKAFASASPSAVNPGIISVDPRVQTISDKYLHEAYENYKATAGFAIVAEVKTGKILAVSNINSEPSAPHSPHWALSLRVEPASVIKAIITAAAIERGATEPGEIHNCENGKLIIGDKEYGDWKPFDKLTTAQSVAMSSNICGIKIGRKLGAEKIQESLKNFGITDPEIAGNFPEARMGVLPKINEVGAEHFIARTATGYGMYTTPLEIVEAFVAIANGGNLFAPTQFNEKVQKPLRRIMSEANAKKMREILGLVMTEGVAVKSQGKKFVLAGKTGTGQSPWLAERDIATKDSSIAHFVGFGPIQDPKYVIYVGIQDPKNNQDHKAHGSEHAAPVFRDIIETLLSEKI